MHALRVNEIELPSETAFVADLFAFKRKKNLKYYQKWLFGTPRRVLTRLLPLTSKTRTLYALSGLL